MILRASIRPKTDPTATPEHIETTAPDFATGSQQLADLTPDGWIRLHIIVDRD